MIYERIEKIAKEKGLSISRLEKECGLGSKTIHMWRECSPRVNTLQKVADYLGVSITYLIEGKKNAKTKH